MSKKENQTVQKTRIDYMQATSLRELLDNVNTHNKEYPENAILKEDIVRILAKRKGISWEAKEHYDYVAFKEAQYDRLADGLRAHMDMEYVYSILREAKISCDWER